VRGLNEAQVGTAAMTSSTPVAVKVVRPTFRITHG
jgi:predicted unusual protein kinase regulating ubiquinone biosynthesis (AarF/ABC1/UbiB family)